MILGFTGTSRGMSDRQKLTVRALFQEHLTELHHGWCIGADAEAHALAKEVCANIVGHPPSDTTRMADLPVRDFARIYPSYRYLTRNRHIVRDGIDGLIATPKTFIQPASLIGEGTWTTIGYARQARRDIWIVYPDGTVQVEDQYEGVVQQS